MFWSGKEKGRVGCEDIHRLDCGCGGGGSVVGVVQWWG